MWTRRWQAAREGRRDNLLPFVSPRGNRTSVVMAVFSLTTLSSVHSRHYCSPRVCTRSSHFDSTYNSSWTTSNAPLGPPALHGDMLMTPRSLFPQEFSLLNAQVLPICKLLLRGTKSLRCTCSRLQSSLWGSKTMTFISRLLMI